MKHKELLDILLSQHKNLKSILGNIRIESSDAIKNASNIKLELDKFKTDLVEHLKLEDSEFYPEVLRVLREKGQKTKDTEDFIAQMKVLGGQVRGFLEKYNSKESIESDSVGFYDSFADMLKKILLRVSAEEEGVYMYLA